MHQNREFDFEGKKQQIKCNKYASHTEYFVLEFGKPVVRIHAIFEWTDKSIREMNTKRGYLPSAQYLHRSKSPN